jgi:predicted enzyme related to lactoylglutathione lyase
MFRAGSPPNGGFYLVKKMPKKGQVNVYVEVENIDDTLKVIKKAKGKVLVKRTQVGSMGWFANFATPDGCYLSLWESAPKEAGLPEEVAP